MKPDRADMPSALQSGQTGERTPFCPDDSTIAACYDGTLPRTEQDRVVQHLAACAYCRARLGMLARLAEKGALSVRKRANTSLYEPLVSRGDARRSAVRS